jgi:TRAP-type C4-dicarboxylate transport system permease small subunit
MSAMSTIESKIINWTRVVSLIGLVGLLLLAAMTVAEALLRWLLNFPMLSIPDVSPLVITVAVASCFPLVFAERRNITVRLAGNLLGRRISMVLEAFGYLVCMVIFCLMVWQLWIFTSEVAVSNETTVAIRMPVAPWYRAATLLIALCIPVQVVVVCNLLRSAFFGTGVAAQKTEVQRPDDREEKGG